jgi:hypothetical protein
MAKQEDKLGWFQGSLSVLFPLYGAYLYARHRETSPRKARAAALVAGVSAVVVAANQLTKKPRR